MKSQETKREDSVETRLTALGLALPAFPSPRGKYSAFRRTGSTIYLSGQGPAFADSSLSLGKVGADLTRDQGKDAARRTVLSLLAALKAACAGDLSQVKGCLKLTGYVNSAPGFTEQPAVIDGATELLFDLFGEAGLPARAAVGVSELPFNIAVELEAIFELRC